jgi:hypothetical protein
VATAAPATRRLSHRLAGFSTGGSWRPRLLASDTGEGVGLCTTLAEYYEAAFPDAEVRRDPDGNELVAEGRDQSAVLACEGDAVRLGIGPDVATARRVAAAG